MRIVILRALGLGDFLTGVPAYRAIRRAFPDARITLAAPRVFRDVLPLVGDAIDDIADATGLGPLPAQAVEADLAIDLHGRGPLSHRVLLATRPRRLIAFEHPDVAQSAGNARFDPNEHEVRRWCRLLSEAGIPADPNDLDLGTPRDPVPRRIAGATLIHPGAASESRRWPVQRWIEVARAERRAGRRVIVTGNAAEANRAAEIAAAAGIPATHVFAGRTSLRELAALVAASGRVVCGDTGVAHLATAFRRPSVLLFGPTPPQQWGPPARRFHHVIWNGSTGDPHAAVVDPGLCAIPAERVIAALEGLAV